MFQSLFSGGSSKRSRRLKSGVPELREVQELEQRALLSANNVVAKMQGSTLKITGDKGDNSVNVNVNGTTASVSPLSGVTTVNGGTFPLDFSGVTQVKVSLKGGRDTVNAVRLDVPSTFNMGGGSDRFGPSIQPANYNAAVFVNMGSSDANLASNAVLPSEVDYVDLDRAENEFDELKIKGGGRTQLVKLDGTFDGPLTVSVGGGNDLVEFYGGTYNDTVNANLGGGNDALAFFNMSGWNPDNLLNGGGGRGDRLVSDGLFPPSRGFEIFE